MIGKDGFVMEAVEEKRGRLFHSFLLVRESHRCPVSFPSYY